MNCCVCKKKVGLLGFTCKCTDKQFCSKHRMPELHNCMYNFKSEYIALLIQKNPVIKATKILKI
jgi:hypothetical protein